MAVVIATNVLVAGLLPRRGASHHILRGIALGVVDPTISAPLFPEYEEVLEHPTVFRQVGPSSNDIDAPLDLIAGHGRQAPLHFMWRPQLRDPNDEMVLEAATNGCAVTRVTFNQRDFPPAADRLSIPVITPSDCLHSIRRMVPMSQCALRIPIPSSRGPARSLRWGYFNKSVLRRRHRGEAGIPGIRASAQRKARQARGSSSGLGHLEAGHGSRDHATR